MKSLRPYQSTAIEKLMIEVEKGQKCVLSAPTGAGKTRIASEIFAIARQQNKRVCFVVPFLSLINQTWNAFAAAGIDESDMSIVQADHPLCNYSRPVQICSIDTLVRRPILPITNMVIFDECHKRSKLHKRWMEEAPSATFIGLSATPWASGMLEIWDKMIVVSTPRELINDGYLSDYKYFAPARPDLKGVRTLAGDYHQGDLSNAMDNKQLVADIVTTWAERAEGRPTLCFCVDRGHAQSVQRQFEGSGIAAGYIDAYTEVEEREALLEQLRTGRLSVICNVGTMTTGVDAPFVSCIILARPTKSEMLYLQIIGRGLRTSPGKDHCLILDHSSTAIRLGLPDTIGYDDFVDKPWESAKREAKKREASEPKPCPKCSYLRMPGTVNCPSCGYVPRPPNKVVCNDGELLELTRSGKAVMPTPVAVLTPQEWWSGLLWIASSRNYKRGWASHKYKEKFGEWPPRNLADTEVPPSAQITNWIKRQQIAWAKSQRNR